MPTIAIVCGAGVAASALVASRLRQHLDEVGVSAKVVEHTVMDLFSRDFRADIIVATVTIPDALGIPVVEGMPILLDTNPQMSFDQVEKELAQLSGAGSTDGTSGSPA